MTSDPRKVVIGSACLAAGLTAIIMGACAWLQGCSAAQVKAETAIGGDVGKILGCIAGQWGAPAESIAVSCGLQDAAAVADIVAQAHVLEQARGAADGGPIVVVLIEGGPPLDASGQ